MSTRPRVHLSGNGDRKECLVVVFLRGAADGLDLVPPTGDDDYHRARLTLGVGESEAVALDELFGLHPQLAVLEGLYRGGDLAIVHAAGSEDDTRSHFEAQDLMEHGGEVAGGWLGRFLRYRDEPASGALSAVAIGKTLPESLRGAPSATVVESIDDFALGDDSGALLHEIERLYVVESGDLAAASRDTVAALRRIEELRSVPYEPTGGAEYPADAFGRGLVEIARLIKGRVGLEAATLDLPGWDSHLAQSSLLTPLRLSLAQGLSSFARDLGDALATTNVVVMTEFGRRVSENASLGTDHGRGSVMLIAGGGIRGGRVIADWPGLRPETLEGPGDLPVIHNYRDVLAPVLERHGAGQNLGLVFPEFELAPLRLFDV